MEIKRKFEILIETHRQFVIRQTPPRTQIACAECGEPMLTTGQAARFFNIKQRRIFQIIEAESAHFTETEAGAAMICLASLAAILDNESGDSQSLETKR